MPEKNIHFDEVVNRKNTDCLKYDFAVKRGMPSDVLPLWVADMDFKTSSLILDKIKDRVEHGIFGYTESGDAYFKAVSGWMKKRHSLTIKEEWIVKTPGVVFALAMAVRAFTQRGGCVLIQQPVYYPFSEVITDNGRKVVSNDLVLHEDGKYGIDFDDFEKKIVKNHIKLFLLCSPHNPVGRVWTKEELLRIADICIKYHVIVVSDEIHEDFVYEGFRHTPFLNIDERVKDICITCTSPAKTFNLAGLQISNIIIPDNGLRNVLKKQIDAAGYSQLNTIGLTACEAAYTDGEEWYGALMKYLQGNLNFVREYLQKELPQIKLIEPEGTYLVWLDFRGLGLCEKELEDLIVHKAKLWLDSGAIFGKSGQGFQRINIATSRSVIKEALERIQQAVISNQREI
ncbi:MAG: pyridoxal phosphate-dependent aminotransferase [Bacillus sp. (in: Bacteria)]|nr:pyridoxal phosphate-dependent aminotransferase [Bacillus sp. (in: firmicutes)]MCM1427749.1 pyridoxal phosphate-dependent aminotransferase [Eubacterium sp.]